MTEIGRRYRPLATLPQAQRRALLRQIKEGDVAKPVRFKVGSKYDQAVVFLKGADEHEHYVIYENGHVFQRGGKWDEITTLTLPSDT